MDGRQQYWLERDRKYILDCLTCLSVDVRWCGVDDGGGVEATDLVVSHVVMSSLLSSSQLTRLLLAVEDLSLFLAGVVGGVEQRGQGGCQGGEGLDLNMRDIKLVERTSYLWCELVEVTVGGVERWEVTFEY